MYEIVACTPEMFEILNMKPQTGQLFDKADVEKKNKVIVLGANPAKKLFGSAQQAVGKSVTVKDLHFKVIGVLESKGGGGFGEPGMDDHVFLPCKAANSFNPDKKYLVVYIQMTDEKYVEHGKIDVKNLLSKRYSEDDFSVSDQKEIMNMLSSIFNVVNLVLVAIAAISLVVGGVGIMNIMYVSVVERIREIGIRRAVGALDHDILFLFLSESVVLSLAGGIIGLIFAYSVVFVIQKFFPAYISLESVLLALGTSFAIGIFFGVFPARKAAKLTPIEAIIHE
jgi:putative ABC transport system permease protein